MKNGDKTTVRLEMTAVKEGNNTYVADDIHWHVSQIDCHCQWHFVNHYPRILNCCHGAVARKIGHPVEPYLLSSVEILLLTCSANKDGGKLL